MLLDEHAAETEPRSDRCNLARVVRLDAADRDERVAPLRERIGREVLELPLLFPPNASRSSVLPLRPDLDLAAEVRGQSLEAVDGRGADEERDAREVLEAHVVLDLEQLLDRALTIQRSALRTKALEFFVPECRAEVRHGLVVHVADERLRHDALFTLDGVGEPCSRAERAPGGRMLRPPSR